MYIMPLYEKNFYPHLVDLVYRHVYVYMYMYFEITLKNITCDYINMPTTEFSADTDTKSHRFARPTCLSCCMS